MLKRQESGAAICYSCNKLISVEANRCIHCGSHNPGLWGYGRAIRRLGSDFGFTTIVTWGCIGLYLLSLANGIKIQGGLDFLSPSCKSLFLLGSTGALPFFEYGRWWTVLSAGWLHGGLIHLAFNMVWIRQLAPSVTRAYGAARLTMIYTISIISGGLLTSLIFILLPRQGAALAIGASGGVFGLFGALVSYGQRMKDYSIKQQALVYTIIGFILGLVMPNVDNWGHLGGFLGGYLITQTPWLNPKKSQKVHDIFVAIACFGMVILSIAVSIIHSVWLLHKGVGLPLGCR